MTECRCHCKCHEYYNPKPNERGGAAWCVCRGHAGAVQNSCQHCQTEGEDGEKVCKKCWKAFDVPGDVCPVCKPTESLNDWESSLNEILMDNLITGNKTVPGQRVVKKEVQADLKTFIKSLLLQQRERILKQVKEYPTLCSFHKSLNDSCHSCAFALAESDMAKSLTESILSDSL